MARRCGCSGTACSCVIQGGENVTVTGAGTADNPLIIDTDGLFVQVLDTTSLNLTRTGSGTAADPFVISGVVQTVVLGTSGNTVGNVTATTPTTGQVLAWNGTAWNPAPAATATPGAISRGNSLTGDGSSGNPLNFLPDPAGRLATGASGADLTADTKKRLVLSYSNTTTRNSGATALGGAVVGMTAWLQDSNTLTVYDGAAWRTVTPEVGNSWRFPRVSALAVDSAANVLTVASGTITGALAGRYLIISRAVFGSTGGGVYGAGMRVTIGGSTWLNVPEGAFGVMLTHTVQDIYTHAGGNLALVSYIDIPGASADLTRDGSGILVVYLGR